jgi:DNA-binding NarL/FixJ family response regulator
VPLEEVRGERALAMSGKNEDRVRILLVDDHPIVRYGMRQLIETEEDMTVCGEAGSAEEGLSSAVELEPDLVIVDISMEGRSGIDLAEDLRRRRPGIPLLFLSIHDDTSYADRALKAGARGYLTKQEAPKLIVAAVRRVMAGEVFLCDRMATRLLKKLTARPSPAGDDSPVSSLSNRELEILEMIGRGRKPKQIAEALHLSIHTIETHRRNIKQKLDLDTASELADFAEGWLLGRR